MNALDTNIVLYAHDHRDPAKQQEAQRLLAALRPVALLWQVGCELIFASRKLERVGFTQDMASDVLMDLKITALS